MENWQLAVLLTGALGPIALYLLLKKPKVSLYLLVGTFPIFTVGRMEMAGGMLFLSMQKAVGLLAFILMIYEYLYSSRKLRLFTPQMLFAFIVLFLMFVSFFMNEGESLSWLQRYFSNIFFIFIMMNWVDSHEELQNISFLYFSILAVTTLYHLSTGAELYTLTGQDAQIGESRMEGIMLDANRAAQAYLLGIGAAGSWLLNTNRKRPAQIAVGVLIVIFSLSLFLTASRSGFIAFVVVAGLSVPVMLSNRKSRPFSIAIIVVTILVALFPPKILEKRIKRIPYITKEARQTQEEHAGSRMIQYEFALDLLTESPFTGVGPNEFNRAYSKRSPEAINRALHSWYLKVATDGGWLSLGAYLLMLLFSLLTFVVVGIRGPPQYRYSYFFLAITLFATMIMGLVSSLPYSKLLYFLVAYSAATWAVGIKPKQEAEKEDEISSSSDTVVIVRKD